MIDRARIRAELDAKGWSQADLARAVGCSQSVIHAVVMGSQRDSRCLPKIAAALGIEISRLDADYVAIPQAIADESRAGSLVSPAPSVNISMQLGGILERIQNRLSALGMSASAASRMAGKPDAVRNLQRALREPTRSRHGISTATLAALAPVLRTAEEWLLTGRGNMEAMLDDDFDPNKLSVSADARPAPRAAVNNVGQRIRLVRETVLEKSQGELAQALRVTAAAVSAWERSGRISLKNAAALADLAGVSFEWLLSASTDVPIIFSTSPGANVQNSIDVDFLERLAAVTIVELGHSEAQSRDLVKGLIRTARRPKEEPPPDDAQVRLLARTLVRLFPG